MDPPVGAGATREQAARNSTDYRDGRGMVEMVLSPRDFSDGRPPPLGTGGGVDIDPSSYIEFGKFSRRCLEDTSEMH